MRRGALRDELQALEADLAKGTPMAGGVAAAQLPEFYKRMILVGVKGGDLPGDAVDARGLLPAGGFRLDQAKGLMVYPLLVLTAAFGLSCFFSVLGLHLARELSISYDMLFENMAHSRGVLVGFGRRPF